MVHSPEKKAAVCAMLMTGASMGEAAKAHNVPKATVQDWADEVKSIRIHTAVECRRERFEESLVRLAEAVVGALCAQAELLADVKYLREQTSKDIIAHTDFLSNRFIKIGRAFGGANQEPDPEPGPLPNVVPDDCA